MKKTLVTAALAAASVLALNAPAMVGADTLDSTATFKVTAGDETGTTGLSLASVPTLDFGTTDLSSIMSGVILKQDNATNELTVKDYREGTIAASDEGWNIQAKMTKFVHSNSDSSITAGDLDGTIRFKLADSSAPGSHNTINGMTSVGIGDDDAYTPTLNTSGNDFTILEATGSNGRGTTSLTSLADTELDTVGDIDAASGNYTAAITWTLASGPVQ